MQLFWFLFLFSMMSTANDSDTVWRVTSGQVRFLSDAPLEKIEAGSDNVLGVLLADKREFAFSIDNNSFLGFNSPLQQEHFYENYIETHLFPKSTFVGKIVEKVDFEKPGTYEVRAKGKLNIHGVSRERIVNVKLISDGKKLLAECHFLVLLDEHDIDIPKIVKQKIAEEIKVWVNLSFEADE